VLGLSLRTLQRWKQQKDLADKRKGASKFVPNKITAAEQETIIAVVNQPEFSSLPPSQIIPILADKGKYLCSERSMYRILDSFNMNVRRGKARTPQIRVCPRLTATQPNQVYSWDITFLPTLVKGEFFYLYLFLDIYSRFIVGWTIQDRQENTLAAAELKLICLRHKITPHSLIVHSDNGKPMKGANLLATMQQLGVIKSFSRPATSNDNPFSEALFKTVKYCPAFPKKPFEDIEQARAWMEKFTQWYNYTHHHSGIKFVTPSDRHTGLDKGILEKRKQVYEQAKQLQPLRWSRSIKNFDYIHSVSINPLP